MSTSDRRHGVWRFLFVTAGFAAIVIYMAVGFTAVALTGSAVFGSIIGDLLCLTAAAAVYYAVLSHDIDGMQRYQPSDRDLLVPVLAMTPLFWFFTECFAVYMTNNVYDPSMDGYQTAVSLDAGGYMILTLFVAPIAEEYLMRGVVYGLFRRAMRWQAAAVFSSALFGAIHGTAAHFYFGLMCGLLFCFMYEYTGMLRYAIGMHFMCNLFSVLIVYVPVPEFLYTDTVSVILTNLVCICAVMLLYVKLGKMKSDEAEFRAAPSSLGDASVLPKERPLSVDALRPLFSDGGTLFVRDGEAGFVRPGSGVILESDGRLVLECTGCGPGDGPDRPIQFYDILSLLSDRVRIVVLDRFDDIVYVGVCLGAKMCSQHAFMRAVDRVSLVDGDGVTEDHVTIWLSNGD